MKNIGTVLLLLLLAAPVFYSASLEWSRNRIQKEMKRRLISEKLTNIELDQKDIHWVEDGKEILVGEHMFDVKKQTILPGGRVQFSGLYDTQETTMRSELKKFQQEQKQKDSRHLAQFFNDWKAIPFPAEAIFIPSEGKQLPFIHPEMEPVAAYSTILKPPPQA